MAATGVAVDVRAAAPGLITIVARAVSYRPPFAGVPWMQIPLLARDDVFL